MKILETIISLIVLVATTLVICNLSRRANDAAYIVAEKKFTELAIQVFPSATGVDIIQDLNPLPSPNSWLVSNTEETSPTTPQEVL